MRTWTTLQCFKSSVLQTLSYLYVDKQVGHHLRGKKNLFPAAYYYSGCTSQTDTCSHVYDCTASCNSPAKIIYRLGATKKKKGYRSLSPQKAFSQSRDHGTVMSLYC